MSRINARAIGNMEEEGLRLPGPLSAADIDVAQSLAEVDAFGRDETMRSVGATSASAVLGSPTDIFQPELHTQYRSAMVGDAVPLTFAGRGAAALDGKASAGHSDTDVSRKLRAATLVLPAVRPLPKSAHFVLEPQSHFRMSMRNVGMMNETLARVLQETPEVGCEVDLEAAKWRCVLSTPFGYVNFDVTAYSEGFATDGEMAFVVEAQRRSGNVGEFLATYRSIRDALLAVATPLVQRPATRVRSRVMPLPPLDLLLAVGGNPREMHLGAFRDTLTLERTSTLHESRVQAVASLAEQSANAAARASLMGDLELVVKVAARLVELLLESCPRIASYAAHALAELSQNASARDVVLRVQGANALLRATEAGTVDFVGLRRASARSLRNCAQAGLSSEDRKALQGFAQGLNSADPVLASFAAETAQLLRAGA